MKNSSIQFAGSTESLLAEARNRAGHNDFGPDEWREGLDRALDEFDEAGFSAEGAVAAREFLLANLVARLKAIAGFKANPDAMARPITRPMIVTGIVRSGTTALHKLLAVDPQFQGAEHWLCGAPQPRPPRAEWAGNPDFDQAKSALDIMIELAPEVLEDHGMAVDTVEESLNILVQNFHCNMFCSQFDLPRYDAWFKSTTDTASYRYLADIIRLIGANNPDLTWLLKNPTDTFSLAEVFEVFPDAMVVQTHRDPLQAVPSLVNLLGGAHRIFRGEGNIDYNRIFAREQEMWAQAMERAEAVKAKLPGRVFDVDFRSFVTDQMGVIRQIYAHFDLTLKPSVEQAMQEWLDANPRKSGTMQRFTPEDYGGSSEELIQRNAAYRQRYGYA
ncbi:MAG: sulfotransferase family protein [Sphingomonadaceae bacterium]